MRVLHVIAFIGLMVVIPGFVEGGGFTCGQAVLALVPTVAVLLYTMPKTGWYYTKENAPTVREHQ